LFFVFVIISKENSGGDLRRQRYFLSLFIVTTAVALFLRGQTEAIREVEVQPDPELKTILFKAGEYCRRLKGVALHFVCLEEVQERIFKPYRTRSPQGIRSGWGRIESRKFVYDYQLIRKNEKIEETRILIKRGRKSVQEEGARLETQRFVYKYVIFGPTGLLSFDLQKKYIYSIEKDTGLWDLPVLVVRAVPKKPQEADCLFGQAWICKDDGSILKIEWEGASIEGFEDMKKVARDFKADPRLRFYSEYRFEKNGIRFPSRYVMKELYYRPKMAQTLEKSELLVAYKDYKFFTVETEVIH
jgi:hypothetical protein